MSLCYNTGEFTEYVEIRMLYNGECPESISLLDSEMSLDKFDNITKNKIRSYIKQIDISRDVQLLQMIEELKVKNKIPDTFDDTLDHFINQNSCEEFEENEIHWFDQIYNNKTIHPLTYFSKGNIEIRKNLL
ncbi:hypothetical protein COBT_003963, partial [Conglomerata obtusa]